MHAMRNKLGLGMGLVESSDPFDLDRLCEEKTEKDEASKMWSLLDRLDTRRPVSEAFTNENRRIDGSGNFKVVDRDTAQVLKSGLPNRASAERWAKKNMLTVMTTEEQVRAERTDPVATAILREHPDTLLVGRF